jgi:pimeloyl-ACP methyl ester carboxylesterase
MSRRQQARTQQTHSVEVRRAYERALARTSVRSRYVEIKAGKRVHLLETGAGPPVVLIHGTVDSAGFLLPLLNELHGVRALAPDLPGRGLSDPIDHRQHRYRETAVAWLNDLLDTLELDTVAVVGHSGGGRWALWHAMAHPGRVKRLVLMGVPGLPKTRCPLPIRLMATPGVGELLSRLVPPNPKSVLRFAGFMGEKATLATHPELVDLMVATGRDPITAASARSEMRVLVSPFGLLSPSGFRRRSQVRRDQLDQLAMPTLMIWGEQDPLGSSPVAQAASDLISRGQLVLLPTGHAPWLGRPAETAATILDFVR